jgi:protein-L-isoaspartate(D-aspartate) O-methyltransferase
MGIPGAAQTDSFTEERRRMVEEQVRHRGIDDPAVLAALTRVPRHLFVPEESRAVAYADTPLPIGHRQTISQPYIVALMSSLLELKPGDKVLEIGTGSGYQAAILSRLCQHVLTIERYRTLADSARARLEKLGYDNIEVLLGDGFDIPPGGGDFDRIMVTAAMEAIPEPLLARLAPAGILVAPVGPHQGTQTLVRVTRTEAGFDRKALVDVRFVPALPGIAREL